MSALKLNAADLVFVLKQIKIAEAHASGTALTEIWVDALGNVVAANTPGATLAIPSPMAPFGLRTVDGTYNNITPGREEWGAADQTMPRLLPTYFRNEGDEGSIDINGPAPGGTVDNENYAGSGHVIDTDPRMISNLIVDMSFGNPAAIVAALSYSEFNGEWSGEMYGPTGAVATIEAAYVDYRDAMAAAAGDVDLEAAALAAFDAVLAPFAIEHNGLTISIPNIAPDEGLSRPFNSWMTFFGQFFDHGLDLINKGGEGTVWVPLPADDPLRTHGPDGIAGNGDEVPPQLAFMALTRATQVDGQNAVNQTTPFVDQNQTYTSHASHQVFLREYATVDGKTVSTGHLLDGDNGNSLPTWLDIKEQALQMLGIQLTDADVVNIPLLRTDAYGNFIPHPTTGYAQVIVGLGGDGIPNTADDVVVSGTPADPVILANHPVIRTGHAFLDDIANAAAPFTSSGVAKTADADDVVTPGQPAAGQYDNELLDRHFITGDGRGNENIGLTTVHHIFHSEHNRQVEQQKLTILQTGDLAFVNEWLLTDIDQATLDGLAGMSLLDLTAAASGMTWDGERLFQSARMATEMQYQHLVFEEFARIIQPAIDPFVFNSTPDINPAIFAEFAHVVYRFGHSMLTDNMPRIGADGELMDDMGLIASFLNPVAFDNDGGITADQAAGAIVRGMTIERGNEIDEFVVNALRNNLLGLPLDLAAINIARGRDTGMPSLNQARQALYDASGSTFLEPYDHWVDFAANLKNPVSVVNFIAAYGTHSSITSATTAEAKRDAAWLLVFGDYDVNGDGIVETAPTDRMQFLTTTTGNKAGLNEVDIWIGGLAEKKMPFGGMLGSTFNAVFELQLENLQDGDRFYYLTRTQGQNFLVSLEQNSFIKMIMANTDLAQPGADGIRGTSDDIIERHIGVDSFGVYDFVYEVDVTKQADYDPDNLSASGRDPTGNNPVLEAMGLGKVIRDDLSTPGADANYIRVAGGEHVTVGGTNGDDTIITDFGDDGIWGDAGNDRIESGAGVDLVNGGAGNDVITDSGDTGDFLKGDEGDDVIAGGNGLDIIMGGEGNDVVFHGVDDTETFAGQGNDFVLGGAGVDLIMGNEGDDWLEGGDGFDTTAGDNSELFFDSKIIGHDVMFSGSEEHDFDAESGDDIMVQGESVLRNEGMFGFDWVTYKGNSNAADVDLTRGIFLTEVQDVLRNRFDKVEGVSGWDQNDFLMGDDRIYEPGANDALGAEAGAVFFRDDIGAAGIARIDGLDEVITADKMVMGQHTSEFKDIYTPTAQELIFSHGNVILGGGGSDVIVGRGGDDLLDGDRWLNVRIRITEAGEANTAENQIATVDSLEHVFTAETAGLNTAWIGKSLFSLLVDRTIVPSQMHIVREIIEDDGLGDTDTAVFWDVIENYTVATGPNGTVVVSHVTLGAFPAALLDFGFRNVSDGTDTLRNIEELRFGDGAGGFITYDLHELIDNDAATGNAVINDTTPLEGQLLTVNTNSIQDQNGLNTFSRQWQVSSDGVNWTNIPGATGTEFTPPNPGGIGVGQYTGQMLRVVVSFTDNLGFAEQIISAPTAPIGLQWTAAGRPTGITFSGFGGGDNMTGSSFADILNGMDGADLLQGGGGGDQLNGGAGNDDLRGQNGNDDLAGGVGDDRLNGGDGTDRAMMSGPVTNYLFVSNNNGSITVTDRIGTDGADTLTNMEFIHMEGMSYQVVRGTGNTADNFSGGAGTQIIFGHDGNDVIDGGTHSDILIGGLGNDTLMGGSGNDFIVQRANADGRDLIDGGNGTDTYALVGGNTAETFRIYTVAEALLAGMTGLNANTEIVITRNGSTNAHIIAELDNIEEIVINSHNASANNGNGQVDGGSSAGDTIQVFGNFAAPFTSLDYSTITVNGGTNNDTVDISNLTSDHRVVFNSNGGSDTIRGDVRTQDVFNGSGLNDQRTFDLASAFGTSDSLTGLSHRTVRDFVGESYGMADDLPAYRAMVSSSFDLAPMSMDMGGAVFDVSNHFAMDSGIERFHAVRDFDYILV